MDCSRTGPAFLQIAEFSPAAGLSQNSGEDRTTRQGLWKSVLPKSDVSSDGCPKGARERSPGLDAFFASNPGDKIEGVINPERVEEA